jgi:hypothetical protein
MSMNKSEVFQGSLGVGDCLQFDLESGTLKVFRPGNGKPATGRRTQDGDDKVLIPIPRDTASVWKIASVILFAAGIHGDTENVSATYGNRPDTLITLQIISR